MLYIGKFINNFKDFYNDINSATLTGAIDVIVVRQPDGSYVCSPFHVRFGKIGVLRSKEKVVDIEVNGVPVDIHMKLGESGEAFFVEEVQTENEIPAYLATSPLPEVPDIQAELQKMKMSLQLQTENIGRDEAHLLVSNTLVQITSEKLKVLNDSSPASNPKDCDIPTGESASKKKGPSEALKTNQKSCKIADSNPAGTEDASNNINTDSSDEYKTKRRRRKKVSTKKRSKPKEAPKSSNVRTAEVEPSDCDKPEEIFQMDNDYNVEEDEGYECSGGMSRSISLPVSTNVEELFAHEWSRRKMSTTFTGEFHPFSDGDVTPQSSPVASRPPSPKSDTEYENHKFEAGSSPDANGPSWGWGQLPNVPRNLSSPHLQSLDDSVVPDGGNKDDDNSTEAEKRSMLGGMLNFMRSTKKMRHMPESEGIYLSELNAEELDPEVAALYFPKFKSSYREPLQAKDEDTESGKGPSLPHSPHTVEGYPLSQDSDSDERLSLDHFSDIAMSLCGGLQDPDVDLPDERFQHSLVTYDEFTENPAILNDPSLVIRMGGKFYNWQTAASMLTSIIMFQRPLPEKATNQLIMEHMPKKKKKSYSSWWSWRRSETEAKPDTEHSQGTDTTIISASLVDTTATSVADATAISLADATTTSVADATTTEEEEVKSDEQISFVAPVMRESVTVEETVEETLVSVVQEVVEETCSEPPPAVTEDEPLEELALESETSADDEVADPVQVPASSESSVASSSPINISSSFRPTSDNPSPVSPETIAQPEPGAKIVIEEPEGDEKPVKEKYMKSLRLSSNQIENLNLNEGPNEFVFSVTTAYQGTTKCTCQVFLWNFDDKIVISDIDGTITKSDVLGHILPMVGHSWAQLGVAQLFTKIKSNGYRFLYLSARAIGQARITREYLRKVREGEICLPDGPLLLSPTSLISALHREVIERKPEEFKISCLKDIQTLYPAFMGNPFYAGFGNKINDNWAYRAVGIPLTRSFTINHRGELKLELIQTFQSSYTRLSDDVDHVFPPLKTRKTGNGNPAPIFSAPEEFSYFTYWREPVLTLNADDLVL